MFPLPPSSLVHPPTPCRLAPSTDPPSSLVHPPTPCRLAPSTDPPPVSMTLTTPPAPGHTHSTTVAAGTSPRALWRISTGNTLHLPITSLTPRTTTLGPLHHTGGHLITRGATESLPLTRDTVALWREGSEVIQRTFLLPLV